MTIKQIPLSKIKVIRHIHDTEVKVGALLQIAHGENQTGMVVMRCDQDAANGFFKGVVLLEGDSAGTFIIDEDLGYPPAIDIGEFACIVVSDPAPRNVGTSKHIVAGDICQASDRDGTFLSIAVGKPIVGYAGLNGTHLGHIIKSPNSPVCLGRAAVVPLKMDELA